MFMGNYQGGGSPPPHFAKLLRWDLLIYICHKIVRFVAVCRFILQYKSPRLEVLNLIKMT
jgi:hypothetical protein